jgi:hypothetical protein
MTEAKVASMDFDTLLDTSVEALPEFVGFKNMPVGLHTAYATLTAEVSKKDKSQFLKLTLTAIESIEVPEGSEPVVPNDEYTFIFGTQDDVALGRIGSAFKPYMVAASVSSIRDLLNEMVGVQVGVKVGSYTSKPDANGVSKTYATLEELLPA